MVSFWQFSLSTVCDQIWTEEIPFSCTNTECDLVNSDISVTDGYLRCFCFNAQSTMAIIAGQIASVSMLPVPNKPYGFCGRKATWTEQSAFGHSGSDHGQCRAATTSVDRPSRIDTNDSGQYRNLNFSVRVTVAGSYLFCRCVTAT